MGLINTNDLKIGMILEQAALNKNGTVILREGSALTEKHINLFKAWGVNEVYIEGVDSEQVVRDEMEALPDEVVKAIERELDELFPPFKSESVMEEIHRIVKKISLREASERAGRDVDGIAKD